MWFKILALALLSAACNARDVVPGKDGITSNAHARDLFENMVTEMIEAKASNNKFP
eukprot:m.468758 g.468758  ORF g.468758 m.468758 type:complete len:56 (-) comp27814_c0_seq1:869-1036(-)